MITTNINSRALNATIFFIILSFPFLALPTVLPQRFDKCVDHSNSLARISSNAVPVIVEDMSKKL